MNKCPLCNRELGTVRVNEHHLVPKTFKGKETITLHELCHNTIHANISERELLHYYHTVDRLLENESIQKYVKWVKRKPPEFYVKTKKSKS